MDGAVIGDLLAPARRSDALAYRVVGDPARSHTYDSFCATTWKTANLLRLYGVHEGSTVGVIDAPKDPDSEPTAPTGRAGETPISEVLFAFLGAASLGATVRFDPPGAFESDALVGPAGWIAAYDPGPTGTTIAYGGPPADPEVVHFETEVWSETPIAPPETVDPETPVLAAGDRRYDHQTLLDAAGAFVDRHRLGPDDSVAVAGPLSEPGNVVGAILAPLLAGGMETDDGRILPP
ncbi:MAG: hypothetical protein ACOCR0_00880, partial [Haloferacaceae archaeon]